MQRDALPSGKLRRRDAFPVDSPQHVLLTGRQTGDQILKARLGDQSCAGPEGRVIGQNVAEAACFAVCTGSRRVQRDRGQARFPLPASQVVQERVVDADGGVGRELKPFGGIEALGRFPEAEAPGGLCIFLLFGRERKPLQAQTDEAEVVLITLLGGILPPSSVMRECSGAGRKHTFRIP